MMKSQLVLGNSRKTGYSFCKMFYWIWEVSVSNRQNRCVGLESHTELYDFAFTIYLSPFTLCWQPWLFLEQLLRRHLIAVAEKAVQSPGNLSFLASSYSHRWLRSHSKKSGKPTETATLATLQWKAHNSDSLLPWTSWTHHGFHSSSKELSFKIIFTYILVHAGR